MSDQATRRIEVVAARDIRNELSARVSVEVTTGDVGRMGLVKDHFDAGTIVHVTCLPSDTYQQAVAIARQLRDAGFNPVPHLAARAIQSRAALDDYLARAVGEAGVERVLLIAGDIDRPRGPFASSLEVLQTGLLQRHGIRVVAFAGHPEGHPVAPTKAMEEALQDKVGFARTNALESEIITQFTFEAEPIVAYIKRIRSLGIDAPVRIGLAGPANMATLIKYGVRCGVGNSLRALRRRADLFGRLVADARPDELLSELMPSLGEAGVENVRGFHLFVFGGLRKSGDWLKSWRRQVAQAEGAVI